MRRHMVNARGVVLVLLWIMTSAVWAQEAGNAGSAPDPSAEGASAKDAGGDTKQERPFISTGQDYEALADMRPEKTVWLDTGANGRVVGLLEQEQQMPAQGAVLILADEGQSADAGLAGALRDPLARDGWATMSLGLEAPPYPLEQARHERDLPGSEQPGPADAAGKGESGAADPGKASGAAKPGVGAGSIIDVLSNTDLNQMRKDYQHKIGAQINAAVSHLRGMGYQRVALVGVGRGAREMVSQALKGSGAGPGEPQMLAWITPTLQPSDLDAVAKASAGQLRILDLRSSLAKTESMHDQRAVIRRGGFQGYQQQRVAMARHPGRDDAGLVAGRVSSWLKQTLEPASE
ncbi:DUF3530 family protein [Marinobacter halodurans]|uniref:DUF3530 family protein n=1 Tax=Marinobacter halodurans TaxID=2528979 RepID=A0ABY1ZQ75_9GAMM|nr:DUF3530 family protein [Marinobacter halodurans]TBW58872.1 DUF3530 family protein [Marinobacter halodurans]